MTTSNETGSIPPTQCLQKGTYGAALFREPRPVPLSDWTAGGLFPAHSTQPGKQQISDCFLMVRLTPEGFVYDRKVTKPNRGVYNCSPKNLVPVH